MKRDAETTGQMVQLVRVARGLTQTELAKRAGLSQAVLSKFEAGAVDLEDGRLAALAAQLDVPVARLTTSEPTGGVLSACAFHRKRNSLPVSEAKRIRANLDLRRMQVETLLPMSEVGVTIERTSPSEDDWDNPETIALEVREAMGLGDGPIPDLVSAVEKTGAVVIIADLGAARIDAIGSWPTGHRPVFMLNAKTSADRRRFTLAHELGHAVMHQLPTDDQESEADRFASELLMPSNAIRDELTELDLPRLVMLKPRWGVSMAALIRKARDVGSISDYDYKQLNIALSTAGYRTNEPVPLHEEFPQLVDRAIRKRLDDGEHFTELAAKALMTPGEFNAIYLESDR
jgi:Zn-dependent peptidase ImmA (M78 family)/transcriptional regulator with XRE-family HTH domain